LQLARGDVAGALAGVRALPAGQAASGEVLLLLGRLLSRQEEWTGALQALDAAALALPGLAEAHALRATAAYNAGELKIAADASGRAVELDPASGAYLASHALYLGYDRRLEPAVSVMQKAMALPGGETADSFIALGGLYRSFRPPRVADAVAAYEKARKLDPKSGPAALGVAESYRAGGQWSRAISAYERVSQAFPRLDGEAALGTAWCYLLSGDDARAKFFTTVAVRGGADVTGIRNAFGRPGGGTAEQAELAERLRSKSAGAQARAAKELLELGRPAVPSLAGALDRKSTAPAVRELIVLGLGDLGPAARGALPQLERLGSASAQAAIVKIRAAP
jgi:tetratricopeptide (TPR) repeat protein